MTKFKELGFDQGVRITRPWNPEMYQHNDRVASEMHSAILDAINKAWSSKDEPALRTIAKAINAYSLGHGYELSDIYDDAIKGLDQMANHWLHEWCWPDLIKAGLVEEISIAFVGYKK